MVVASPGIVWHCEVRDGLLVMKMSNMLFCLVGVVIINLFRVGCEKHL